MHFIVEKEILLRIRLNLKGERKERRRNWGKE